MVSEKSKYFIFKSLVQKYIVIYLLLILIIIISGAVEKVHGQLNEKVFRVKYLSAENVYIDGGLSDSLMIGDQLLIIRNGSSVAKIEIVFLADHSASCKILSKSDEIKADDRARVLLLVARPETKDEIIPTKEKRAFSRDRLGMENQVQWAKVSGNLSVQWYMWEDENISNLDFKQPSARLNLRLRRLWGSQYNFRFKMRSRYLERNRTISSAIPQNEWLHRVYELSLSYDDEQSPYHFSVGRILTNHLSGVGYIDGAQFQHRVYYGLNAGFFAGTQPGQRRSEFTTEVQKYGLFLNYIDGDYSGTRFESTIAGAGEYFSGEISREFLYLYNNLSISRRWAFYHSMQLDINRGWRKDYAKESIQITNLILSARYMAIKWLNVSLSYDSRKSYRNHYAKDIPVDLFDAAARHGFRSSVNIDLPNNFRLSSNAGIRFREGDKNKTISYGMNLSNYNLFKSRFHISARFNGYNNQFTSGFNPALSIGKSINGSRFSVAYGIYQYKFKNSDLTVSNQWARLTADISLIWQMYSSIQYEYNWNGDIVGHRGFLEIGYRF